VVLAGKGHWAQPQESVGLVSLVEKKEPQRGSFGQKNTDRKQVISLFEMGKSAGTVVENVREVDYPASGAMNGKSLSSNQMCNEKF